MCESSCGDVLFRAGRNRTDPLRRKAQDRCGAASYLALEMELASVHGDHGIDERKPQTRAFVPAAQFVVGLNERLKHAIEIRFCDANSCVTHDDGEPGFIAVRFYVDMAP